MIRGMPSIVKALIAQRSSSGLSLGELSRRTGYDKRGISGWERQVNVPSLQCAMDWANALGYEIVMVKTGYEVKPGAAPARDARADGKLDSKFALKARRKRWVEERRKKEAQAKPGGRQ